MAAENGYQRRQASGAAKQGNENSTVGTKPSVSITFLQDIHEKAGSSGSTDCGQIYRRSHSADEIFQEEGGTRNPTASDAGSK
jgi:hypothetical protein